MKIKPLHLERLRKAIEWVLENFPNIVEDYEQGRFTRADKVKELQKRFCFDLLYAAGVNHWVVDELYPYMGDTHLYTALKAVSPKVIRKY